MSSFDEMMANMYQVEMGVKGHGSGVAGFPRSHDGLERPSSWLLIMARASRSRVRLFGATNLMVTSFPTTRSRIDFFS